MGNLYKASASQTLIDGVPHSLHFQFTARCNRRCLLIVIDNKSYKLGGKLHNATNILAEAKLRIPCREHKNLYSSQRGSWQPVAV